MPVDPDKELIASCSQDVYDGFKLYDIAFHKITQRAKKRFENRDWQGHQHDIVERVELYEKSVRRVVMGLRKSMGEQIDDHALWKEIRDYFGQRLYKVPDADFIKTFFNSVSRRIFDTQGNDPEVEFVSSGYNEDKELITSLNIKRYPYWVSLRKIFASILEDFSFRIPFIDITVDAAKIADEIHRVMKLHYDDYEYLRLEFIDSIFYQSKRAYLTGRIILSTGIEPIVIAFKHKDAGIAVDAVLIEERDVSIVFGYTRSYYFADPKSVVGAVHFLHSLLPTKPLDELYTVLGRLRQGKTERHRIFTEHMQNTTDLFEHADGDTGLVMIVFNLPSYDLVFKVIRDRFGYPKNITREEVINKYKLVSKHDRAGRLIDTQEFLNLEFPINRFSEELKQDLLTNASITVKEKENNLLLEHVYVERRVRPLNLYIRENSQAASEAAIIDYGQAIKDLGTTDIFPGDLLLKNFGVTQHGRIIFYDYDEVSLVSECQFREVPASNDMFDDMRADNWFHVNPNDIFPEEFIKFLSMNEHLREIFMRFHGDILTAQYWREIKQKHLTGNIELVVPYMKPADHVN